MRRVAEYVARHPGCVMRHAADYVNPHPEPWRNNALGYRPVHRAIEAGLVRQEPGPRRGTFVLFPAFDDVEPLDDERTFRRTFSQAV